MSGALSLLAAAALIALAAWTLAGLVLRIGGAVLAVGGLLVTALTGSPWALLTATIGSLAWFAGHWLFAVRHHFFASPLAHRIVVQVLPDTPTEREEPGGTH
jgi:hypothetical protein